MRRYLLGEYVALPGAAGAVDEPFARPFRLAGETLHDMPALTRALARNWDAGRALLLDGTLARFFRLTRPDMEEICLHAERDAARRPGHEDVISGRRCTGSTRTWARFTGAGRSSRA